MDGTWVYKWKVKKFVNEHGATEQKKVIAARLTARGFKDLQAYDDNIATYSGTATKSWQRIVCGYAAQHQYTLF